MQPGYVFTPTDRVTATKLNNLVNIATINPTFISDKGASIPQAADNFLFYRSGVLYRTPFSSMGQNNTNLIVSQTEDPTPALDDYLLTFKTSVGQYRKTQVNSLVMTNNDLIMTRTSLALPTEETFYVLGQESTSGSFYKIGRSNYFYNCFNFVQWTNLARYALGDASPITFAINDAATGTNYQTSFDGLINQAPVITTNDASGYVVVMTNGLLSRMTMADLKAGIVGGVSPQFSTSTAASGITAAGSVFNTAHGLPGQPTLLRASLVCTATDAGYAVGDEVDLVGAPRQPVLNVYLTPGTIWASASNIGFSATGTFADINLAHKTTGALTVIAPAKWDLKITAVYLP